VWVSLEGLAWRMELSVWNSRLMMGAPPGVPGLARDIIVSLTQHCQTSGEDNSVFIYCNKQAGVKMRWVRYIALHY